MFYPHKSISNGLCKLATHFGWEPTRDANKRPPSVLLSLRAGARPLVATLAARSSAAAPGPSISPIALPPSELVAGRAALSPRLFFSSPMLFQAAVAVRPAGSVPMWPRPDPWPWGLDPPPLWPDLWSALLGGVAAALRAAAAKPDLERPRRPRSTAAPSRSSAANFDRTRAPQRPRPNLRPSVPGVRAQPRPSLRQR